MKKVCFLLFAVLAYLIPFSQTITIGTGINTDKYSPWYPYFGYSYVQTLYLQNEIAAGGNITSISYYYAGSSLNKSNDIVVYMGHTSKAAFTNVNDWIPLTSLTEVFGGTIPNPATTGWITIALTTPFTYNDSENLVIAIDENKAGFNGSTGFRSTKFSGSNRVLAFYNDNTNPNPAIPPSVGGQVSDYVGNIRIDGLTIEGCQTPTGVQISSIATNAATASWSAPVSGSTVADYVWELRTSGAPGSGAGGLTASGNVTDTMVSLGSLLGATYYKFYVKSNCGSSLSGWSQAAAFATLCTPANVPYKEDFENVSGSDFPICTTIENAGTGNDWEMTVGPGQGFNSNTLTYSYNSNNTANAWFFTRGINLIAGKSYRLAFKYGNSSSFYSENLKVLYGTAQASADMTEQIVDIPGIVLNGAAISTTDFVASSSGIFYIGFNAYSDADEDQLYVDDISLIETPTCDAPTDVMVSNITTSSAQLDWTPPTIGSPANYQVYYSTSDVVPADSVLAIDSTSNISLLLNGLNSGTRYYVWLRSNCGGGDLSAWSQVISFTTNCTAVATFTENFDGVTAPDLPVCWSKVGTAGNAYVQALDAASGTNTLYIFSNSTADLAVVALPPVNNLADGTHRLTFKARGNFSPGSNIEVGFLSDVTDPNSFNPIETVTIGTLSYQTYTVTPGHLPGVEIFAFRHTGDPDYSALIDDVSWQVIPSCEPPVDITFTTITTSSAVVGWSPPASSSPQSYSVYYSTSRIAPDSSTVPMLTGINTNTTTLTNLVASTTYYVWLMSNCGAGDSSLYSAVDSFTTSCSAITTFPFTENFDNVITPALPPCFTELNNNGDDVAWQTYDTYGVNGSNAAGLHTDFNQGENDDYLVLPPLNLTGHQRLRFSVSARSSFEANDYRVVLSTTNADPAAFTDELVPLTTVSNTTQTPVDWIDLSSYTGSVYIAIHVPPGGLDGYYLYVDDIIVEDIPSCPEPTDLLVSNVTTTSAQLDWTPPAASIPANYGIYYSTVSSAPSDTTIAMDTTSAISYMIANLSPSTTYYAWVRSMCSTTDMSTWTPIATFTTLCAEVDAFTEDFDNVVTPNLPVCWNKVGADGSAYTQSSDAFSDPNTLYLYSGSASNMAVVSLPPVSNLADGTHRLSFKARGNFTAGANIEVGYLSDPTDASSFSPLETVTVNSLDYVTYNVDPGQIAGAQVLAFRHTGSPAYSVLIDDVSWQLLPSCDIPVNITVSNITVNSAQLDWNPPSIGSPSSYDIYISTTSGAPDSTTVPTMTNVAANSLQLDSLQANTTYYVSIRTNCSGGGNSEWSSAISFTTKCAIIIPPSITEQFEADQILCWSQAKGILSDPTTFTGDVSLWSSDYFTNDLTPYNLSASLNIYGSNRNDWLISPSFDLGSGTIFQLEFDLALTPYGTTGPANLGSDDIFALLISTDDGVTWAPANILRQWDQSTPISSTGEHIIIDLSGYTGIVKFAFYGESTVPNEDNDIFVDNFKVVQTTGLPVTFVNFNGSRDAANNLLSWTTRTEHNNLGFELQHSNDGINFSKLTFVGSKAPGGNSSVRLTYSFADVKPFYSTNWYRLKQFDKDGMVTYSNVVEIKGSAPATLVLAAMYPNPVRTTLNMVVNAPVSDKVKVVVTDLAGKIVMQNEVQIVPGYNKMELPVSKLLSGAYIIKVYCNKGCETAIGRFIKQ